jgi:AcrR family transcriptional regulator
MARKAPRRTAERILETALELFNRFGEPNVSTTLIATTMGISPGNLYYHYPGKDELVNVLFEQYALSLDGVLDASGEVQDVEGAWFFMHTLFERLWAYRFLYRDLNELLSRNRLLEERVQDLLARKQAAMLAMLDGLHKAGAMSIDSRESAPTACSMVVVLAYWLSYEFARDPRRAQEPEVAQQALLRGAHHVLHLLAPYLVETQRAHLLALAGSYDTAISQDNTKEGQETKHGRLDAPHVPGRVPV